jgi:hypothetical protein
LIIHAHGAIWKERGILASENKDIKHPQEIYKLTEAVLMAIKGDYHAFPQEIKRETL